MKISVERLAKGLKGNGFQLVYFAERTGELMFLRRHCKVLFERVRIGQGWRRGGTLGDLVAASVQCTIVPCRTALKGLAQSRCLLEVASEQSTGWTKLANENAAEEWEKNLISIAPLAAKYYADAEGPSLLESTGEARRACSAYYEKSMRTDSVEKNVAVLKISATEKHLKEVDRILKCPINMIPGASRPFYELATLAIVLYCGEMEGDPNWTAGKNPDGWEHDLRIRLQYLASRFANEPGWDLPVPRQAQENP